MANNKGETITAFDITPNAAGYRGIALMFIQDVVGRIQGNQAKKDTEELLGTVVKISMFLATTHPDEAHKLLNEVYKEGE